MNRFSKVVLPFVLALLVVAASGTAYYYYNRYQTAQQLLSNPDKAAKEANATLLAELGTFMQLPANEDPSIATVLDATKLKDQAFFANAQNGDKVIIYTKSAQAILYRQSAHKIISVAPISISQPTPGAEPSAKTSVKPTPKPTAEETTKPAEKVTPAL